MTASLPRFLFLLRRHRRRDFLSGRIAKIGLQLSYECLQFTFLTLLRPSCIRTIIPKLSVFFFSLPESGIKLSRQAKQRARTKL